MSEKLKGTCPECGAKVAGRVAAFAKDMTCPKCKKKVRFSITEVIKGDTEEQDNELAGSIPENDIKEGDSTANSGSVSNAYVWIIALFPALWLFVVFSVIMVDIEFEGYAEHTSYVIVSLVLLLLMSLDCSWLAKHEKLVDPKKPISTLTVLFAAGVFPPIYLYKRWRKTKSYIWPFIIGFIFWTLLITGETLGYIEQHSDSLTVEAGNHKNSEKASSDSSKGEGNKNNSHGHSSSASSNSDGVQNKSSIYSADEIYSAYRDRTFEIVIAYETTHTEGWVFTEEVKEKHAMSGSGFMFFNDEDYGLIITNRHVIIPGEGNLTDYAVLVRWDEKGKYTEADVVAVASSKGLDLAILRVSLGKGSYRPYSSRVISNKDISQGESCVAIGNALGKGISVTTGVVSRVNTESLVLSAPLSPGNSGGPVFLNNGGLWAGIVVAREDYSDDGRLAQNYNYAIPINYVAVESNWAFIGEDQERTRSLLRKFINSVTE